jgi:hypothetical protein
MTEHVAGAQLIQSNQQAFLAMMNEPVAEGGKCHAFYIMALCGYSFVVADDAMEGGDDEDDEGGDDDGAGGVGGQMMQARHRAAGAANVCVSSVIYYILIRCRMQMAAALASMTPEQRTAMAAQMGLPPEQLNALAAAFTAGSLGGGGGGGGGALPPGATRIAV